MDRRHPTDAVDIVWEPCGLCWGQRLIWHPDPETGRMRPRACGACVGVGARAVVSRAARVAPARR